MTDSTTNPSNGWLGRASGAISGFRSALSSFGQGAVPQHEGKYSYVITNPEHQQRIVFALAIAVLGLVIAVQVGNIFFGRSSGLYFGTAAWLFGLSVALPHFVVIIPEITALMTVNLFRKPTAEDEFNNLLVYPTGLYIKYPWERAKLGNYINLRYYSFNISENIAAKEGPMLDLNILAFWRPNVHLLPRNIAFEGEDIQADLGGYITGHYSSLIAREDVHKARQNIHEMDKNVLRRVLEASTERLGEEEVGEVARRQGYIPNLEFLTGSQFSSIRIVDADYESAFQKSLTNNATGALVMRHARELMQDQKDENGKTLPGTALSAKEAENAALIVFQLVTKTIEEKELNVNDGLSRLVTDTLKQVAKEWFDAKYKPA